MTTKLGKLPALMFYVSDHFSDPGIRSLSYAAKGLWSDLLCLMHEGERRGFLELNGHPMTIEQIARMTGGSVDEVKGLLTELKHAGVYDCTERGTIYSRRMVRDESKRQKCSEAGKKGGGSPTFKGVPKGDLKGDLKGPLKGVLKGFLENENETKNINFKSSTGEEFEKGGRRASAIPPDFQITPEMEEWASKRVADVAGETEHFKDHHRANGSTFKDWPAAWRNWIRNAVKFAKNGKGGLNGGWRKTSTTRVFDENVRAIAEYHNHGARTARGLPETGQEELVEGKFVASGFFPEPGG